MRIAYVTPVAVPDLSAASQRILGVADAMTRAGHDVTIGSGQTPESAFPGSSTGRIPVHALGELPIDGGPLRKGLRQLTWGGRTLLWLEQLKPVPDVVIIYGGSTPYVLHLLPWCKKHDVRLVVDAVEWYDPTHLPGGRLGPFSASNALAMRYYYPKTGNAIVISSYLQRHFESHGCRTVLVPPTRSVADTPARLVAGEGPLRLVYAGTPGRKDLLDTVSAAILQINARRNTSLVALDVAGPDREALVALPSLREFRNRPLPSWLTSHGRITPDAVNTLLRSADFMPLLRSTARFAQAGFPTKVVESLSAGTPVIANLTGDLGQYLEDGREGLICASATIESMAEVLRSAIAMPVKQRTQMRINARRRAEIAFDTGRYVEAIDAFLNDLLRPL